MLELTTVDDLGAFDLLAAEWDALVLAGERPSPFMLHGWLRAAFVAHERGELLVHVARRDGRLVAALPLCLLPRRGLRVLTFVGGDHAHVSDALALPGEEDAAAALCERAAKHPGDLADLFGMRRNTASARVLGRALRLVERVEAPILDLNGSWESVYAAKCSAKTRQTHRRKRRRLEEAGALEVKELTTWAEIEPAMDETFRVHALRWEGRPDGSGIGTAAGRVRERDGYRALAEAGIARLLTMELDGTLVAYNGYFVLAGAAYLHRLAFDPALGRLSPGLLCTLEMCERAAAEGLDRVEFLGGDEDYKLQLADRFDPLLEGFGLARTVRGRASVGARLATVRVRKKLKSVEAFHRLYKDGLAPARRAVARLRRRPAEA